MSFSYGPLFGATLVTWLLYQWYLFEVTKRKVRHIPTVGSDGFISSYISAWRFTFDGHRMIEEGYAKYPGAAFKVPTLKTSTRWLIILNGPQLIEDIRKAPESELSFEEVASELLQTRHTFGVRDNHHEHYHVDVVRGPMTRGFPSRFNEIRDEIVESFFDHLPPSKGWTGYPIHKALIPIVCRTTNRLFVGLPLCRNAEYCSIQENLVINIVIAANILNVLPAFIKPLVGRLISNFPAANRTVQKYVGPMISEREEQDAKLGPKWEGRPNDLISWLLDTVPEKLRNIEDLSMRLILINFAAIHTTSITLSNTLFELAARQEYIEPLRSEIEEVIGEYGWTKESMGKMRKVDSFMKECSRIAGLSATSVNRVALKDTTLSNGVVIPAGFRIAVASQCIHEDKKLWEDASTFKGFRFAEMREGGQQFDHLRHQMVSLDSKFFFFGHGRAACPGRFFAVNEVKAMLSHILLNYDIKLPNDSTEVPSAIWIAGARSPNSSAEILFRKRQGGGGGGGEKIL